MSASELPGLPAGPTHDWLRSVLPDDDRSAGWTAELISGGLSNLTYRIHWGSQQLVLRRPPLGHLLPRAHDMRRESRVMSALGPTAVPVPEVIAFCDDESVLGVPFYLMREVEGLILRDADDAGQLTPQQRETLSGQLVDALADLHAVDPDAVGLGDFGSRGDYASRQLRTWGKQWQRSRTRDLPDVDRLLDTLARNLPGDPSISLVHGDYRFDNTVIDVATGPRIAAVLDWELSTLGDPLADLATLLMYWQDPDDTNRRTVPVAVGLTTLPGFPTRSDLAERYAARTGRELSSLTFHLALAAMRLAVIFEGIHSRYLTGNGAGQGYATAGDAVPVLAAYGLQLLRNSPSRNGARPADASITASGDTGRIAIPRF
jgi:aminoglycoside phosphotransferase (APT) family kinase protein